ncbi:LUD domain-containing protein [Haloarcula sp. GH36]|uniref:LUD domain-containing protein n=1 Tax=Haloarcula montana TaxID=3111776 RepID=UPI002D783B3C|nr:LUD domain-containing protein [Haloarcula sp. GH36]
MTESDSPFAASLDELGVTVTSTDRAGVPAAIDEAVVKPAVGVSPGEEFAHGELPLAEAGIDLDPTPAALEAATTGVSVAELGIGDYGSLALTSTGDGSELVSLFVERHVALLHQDDIAPDMDEAVETLETTLARTRGSTIIATGPSATADMGALVKGAHGPETVHVIVVEGE